MDADIKQALVIGGGVVVGITGLKILRRLNLYNRGVQGAGNLAAGVLNPIVPVGGFPTIPPDQSAGQVGLNAPAVRAGQAPQADYTQFATVAYAQ